MFIGGLNWETTDGIAFLYWEIITYIESLRAYFEQFGEITECTVMRENQTGRSRGFGFLTFKDPKVVNVVMVKEHVLDGKIVSFLQVQVSNLRLIQNEQFLVKNKIAHRRFLSVASDKMSLRKNLKHILNNLEQCLMPPL